MDDFFDKHEMGDIVLMFHDSVHSVCTVEELYQAFKTRLLREMREDGLIKGDDGRAA